MSVKFPERTKLPPGETGGQNGPGDSSKYGCWPILLVAVVVGVVLSQCFSGPQTMTQGKRKPPDNIHPGAVGYFEEPDGRQFCRLPTSAGRFVLDFTSSTLRSDVMKNFRSDRGDGISNLIDECLQRTPNVQVCICIVNVVARTDQSN